MNKKWVIAGLCIQLFLAGTGIAKAATGGDEQCSLEAATHNLNTLEALQPWFIHEQDRGLDEYQLRISQLESQTGAYGEQLAPVLISIGLLQQETGNHSGATKAFQRALHIIRINSGLYSPKQLPLLELLIETNTATDEWQEVANKHDFIYWLYKRNYGINDPKFLPVVKRLRSWHIESYNKATGRSLSEHFNAADKLYTHAVDIIRECTGDRQQALCFWHKSCCADAPDQGRQCDTELASRERNFDDWMDP